MSFRQIKLVMQREYLTKIRSKAFIIATILIPLGFIAFMGIGIGIQLMDSTPSVKIAVVDQTHQLYPRLHKLDASRYQDGTKMSDDSLRAMVQSGKIDGFIHLGKPQLTGTKNPQLIYGGSGGFSLLNSVENDLQDAIRAQRLQQAHVSDAVQQIYSSRVTLNSHTLTKEGKETEDHTGLMSGIGMIMGIVIFMSLFGYGGLLTRSVIEEKTNRIVEVIASSVKPTELLIGKMIGIGALGLTQIAFWIAAVLGISMVATPLVHQFTGSPSAGVNQAAGAASGVNPASFQLPPIDPMLLVYFVIFFLLGYLIYSTFFAAIGAAVDSQTDTQQFMFPVMLPIMIAYFIMFQTIASPDSTLSVVGSIIPLFTPIVMITRIAITDVPFWQIGLSILLMIATFCGAIWLCAKIYRVGILSYGQSASFKELWKWIKQ